MFAGGLFHALWLITGTGALKSQGLPELNYSSL